MVKVTARTSPTGTSGSNGGFTLLELIIVLAVMGLVFSLTVPRFQAALDWNTMDRSTRNLIGVIRNARGSAAGEGVNYFLHFDMSTGRYWMSREVPEGGMLGGKEEIMEKRQLPESVRIKDVETAGKGAVAQGEAVIRFWRNGLVESASIHLENDNKRALTLVVNPVTGAVKVEEGYVRQFAS